MYTMDEFIAHHGILGQRWGIRRYQNKDGSLTAAGRKHWDQLDRKTKAKIKDNMIRSSNVKVLQAHQKYLTPNELRKATERLAANKRVSDFSQQQIEDGFRKIQSLGVKAQQVGQSVQNLTNAYNNIAKVINGVSGKDLPIIGEKKGPRKFSINDLKNLDMENLKGDELANAVKTIGSKKVVDTYRAEQKAAASAAQEKSNKSVFGKHVEGKETKNDDNTTTNNKKDVISSTKTVFSVEKKTPEVSYTPKTVSFQPKTDFSVENKSPEVTKKTTFTPETHTSYTPKTIFTVETYVSKPVSEAISSSNVSSGKSTVSNFSDIKITDFTQRNSGRNPYYDPKNTWNRSNRYK